MRGHEVHDSHRVIANRRYIILVLTASQSTLPASTGEPGNTIGYFTV